MEIHQSAIYTIQITRGIVIYLCFLRGSNLDILPKVGEWAGKVVKWWRFNLCSCHGPHYYIESKVLSGMIYHSIEYWVIPSAFNTQERIQNCKRLVMMHISWVNHKYMEEQNWLGQTVVSYNISSYSDSNHFLQTPNFESLNWLTPSLDPSCVCQQLLSMRGLYDNLQKLTLISVSIIITIIIMVHMYFSKIVTGILCKGLPSICSFCSIILHICGSYYQFRLLQSESTVYDNQIRAFTLYVCLIVSCVFLF